MLAHICGLKTGEFTHFMGDTHIYKNHMEQCKTQMERSTMPFPKLIVNPSNREIKDITDFRYKDFKVVNYYPHSSIKADMAV
jgi:thymidylate synthase